ncbi:MAG TPA: 4'-phosphopantetheinyl transferase superfamily protein [Phycisphaerae bacterium]|nr:4'-phosphopantetheinyl transferase superfamily protein [Phycisphaerae bacterium]
MQFIASSTPPPASNDVHVWQIPLAADADSLRAALSALSPAESQRAARFRSPDDRRRYAVAHATLRRLLARYSNCRPDQLSFTHGPRGKPELADARWRFNLSHSGDRALLAIAPPDAGGIGVDIEQIRPLDFPSLARTVFPPPEQSLLAGLHGPEQADHFFRLWVRHEARVKAIGGTLGDHAGVPVFDLHVSPDCRAALATSLPNPQVRMLTA